MDEWIKNGGKGFEVEVHYYRSWIGKSLQRKHMFRGVIVVDIQNTTSADEEEPGVCGNNKKARRVLVLKGRGAC